MTFSSETPIEYPLIIVVMGVSGSGKSTIGRMLADTLHLPFYDGDDFHPVENVVKMQAGIPLEDADRYGWLERLHKLTLDLLTKDGGVIACSALKESYRQILSDGITPHVKWILLEGEYDLIKARMQSRDEHYMPTTLLASQFATLEIPEYALRISIDQSPEHIVQQIMSTLSTSTIGIIGLGVMGRNLALNFADKGVALSLYNRHVEGKEEHIARDLITTQELKHAQGFDDIRLFVASLQQPRRILLMVEAGQAVDAVCEQVLPLLDSGDVIADCGNSHYHDTKRRQEQCAAKGIHFLGVGVSGGEKGARFGPAIMPGGNADAYTTFLPALESIAARDKDGQPCCTYIGSNGAGHFVKMVHNGIEYAEMQLIAEVYGLLRHGMRYPPDQIADLFAQWNAGVHRSFLLEITIQILRTREGDSLLLDKISDATRSKGTGGWALQAANDLGVPSPMLAAAVHARFLFGNAEERARSSKLYAGQGRIDDVITTSGMSRSMDSPPVGQDILGDAFCLARITNHHLGFALLRAASKKYNWDLNLQEIARIWTNGCIIRSALMERLVDILKQEHLILLHPEISAEVLKAHQALSEFATQGIQRGIGLPCHTAALNFLNGYINHQPTGNLIQAQRDLFGVHGFQRNDDSSGKTSHF